MQTRQIKFIFLLSLLFYVFSGCHVNFAVTVGVALSGGMKLILVPFYLIAQLLGSLVGAGIASVR